jgi:phosphate transport system substrate-binding protein
MACKEGSGERSGPETRFDKGTIHISCDETFKPVMDAQVEVYEALYPDTKIIVHYKPEAECFRDFGVDSIKMVIATRGYSKAEENLMVDSLHVGPDELVVARDLIAVIVNPASKDTFFSIPEIKALLTGKYKENLIPVFDGVRETSTVRFMLDSVLKGENLGKNVVAAKSSVGVIEYVSKTPNAVGFVGYSWIGNKDDTSQLAYMKRVRTAYVESTDSAGAYIHPSQYFIYTNSYPLIRDLFYIIKEKNSYGLAHAFAHFLTLGDKGQLIFRRSYLMPVNRPSYIRDARLQDTINK